MNEFQFLNHIKANPQLKKLLKEKWVAIGNLEYKFSPAFGGERINVLYREMGKEAGMYPILFAGDVDDFY